jgi:hypothetical protein
MSLTTGRHDIDRDDRSADPDRCVSGDGSVACRRDDDAKSGELQHEIGDQRDQIDN